MALPELRVHVRARCVVNPEPRRAARGAVPLLGIFVPKLIEMAIGGVATWLRKAGGDETVSVSGRALTDLYVADDTMALRPNPDIGCVIAIAGTFDDGRADAPPAEDPALRRLEEAGVVSRGAVVNLIFEAAIRLAPDRTACFLDMRHFSVREPLGKRKRKERAYVVTVSVVTPGATADGDTIAIGAIDVGGVDRGGVVTPGPRLRSNLMPWGQISRASKAAYDADAAAGSAAGRRYMPVTFDVTVSETADGSRWLRALGELVEGAKKEAAAELSKLVLPDERARAEAGRESAAEALYAAELDAELAVRKAQREYDAASEKDKPVLRAELEIAIRRRDRQVRLRQAAGLPARDPVPES